MQRVQSDRDIKMKQINDDIDDANRNIRQLQDTINSLKTSADEYAFKTEDKSAIAEIKNLLSESNALKCDSTHTQKIARLLCSEKDLLVEKKVEL